MNRPPLRLLRPLTALVASTTLVLALSASASGAPAGHHDALRNSHHKHGTISPSHGLREHVFAVGGTLTNPDDITSMDGRIFVVWQNGTQPDGSGPGTSTIVAYRNNGVPAGRWNIPGHVDGLTADPARHRVIITSNEDANSSLYTITPHGRRSGPLNHYTYSPDPSTLTGGGTDAISIVHGKILISASNPQNATGPAVFQADVPFNGTVATLTPYFNDNSSATDALTGKTVTLHLTDPDSNAVVPKHAGMFGGDFVLNSQGDSELIFAADHGSSAPSLTALSLNAGSTAPQVDDVRWATSPHGTLFVTDAAANKVYAITGSFGTGTVLTAIPGDSPSLAGDIGTIDLTTGTVTPVLTGFQSPKGMIYLPGHAGHARDHGPRH